MASEWHGDKMNGIEFRWLEDGDLDEVCMYADGVCILHIERMSDQTYWAGLYGKTHDAHLMFGSANGRSYVKFHNAEGWPATSAAKG